MLLRIGVFSATLLSTVLLSNEVSGSPKPRVQNGDTGVVAVDAEVEPEHRVQSEKFALAIDVGAGVINLLHFDLGLVFAKAFSIGGGVGMLPLDSLLQKIARTDELAKADDIDGFQTVGDAHVSLYSFSVFARLHPWKRAFFLEGTFEAWRLAATVSGEYTGQGTQESLGIETAAVAWQKMVGIHLGWRIRSKVGLFVEVMVGVNYLMDPSVDLHFGGAAVREAQSNAELAGGLAVVTDDLEHKVEGELRGFGTGYSWVPTGALRLGWAFSVTN